MKKIKLYKIPYYLWIIIFVILPLLLVLFKSFHDMDNSLSLTNYQQFFTPVYVRMTFSSFFYAIIITFLCLIVAYPAAYIISKMHHQKLILMLLIIPSWINLLLKTYAFMAILGKDGLVMTAMSAFGLPPKEFLFTVWGFLIVAVYIYIPFMILPIYNSITNIPKNYLDAASDLGATSRDKFFKIIVPLSKRGVYSGIQIVFIPTLSIFMITRLIAGNRVITLGTAIEEHFLVTDNWGMGSAIGTILIIILIISILIMRKIDKNKPKKTIDIPTEGGML